VSVNCELNTHRNECSMTHDYLKAGYRITKELAQNLDLNTHLELL